MPQITVLSQWRADYPILAPPQKPSGIIRSVTRTASAGAWAAGKITLTLPSLADVVGTQYDIVVAGFTPAGYNGSYRGTVASATSMTYLKTTDPGATSVLGNVTYTTVVPLTI